MHYVYILYSRALDKFYVGETFDLQKRLIEHNTGFYDNSFTRRATDWELFIQIDCVNTQLAKSIEKHIKSMKSRDYIYNLKKYPEITLRLKERYSS